jgi:hypothetical protein
MNLDSKKLLPPSKKSESQKINADKFLVPVKNIQYKNIVKLSETKEDQPKVEKFGLKDEILSIKESILSIEKSIAKSLDLQKEKILKDKLDRENKRRQDKEEKLEQKKDYGFGKIIKNIPKPKLSFIDWIKRFVLNMFLGYFAVRVIDYLPTIISIASKITPAINFIGWMGKNLLKGLIDFIDWGYKAYDATRGFIKQVAGDGAQKQFDSFSKNLNDVLNYTIVTALGIAALADKVRDKNPNNKTNKKGQPRDPRTNRPVPTDKKGNYSFHRSGGAYNREVFRKTDWSYKQYDANENQIMRRYARKYGRDAAVDKFGKESVKDIGGKYGRSKLTNAARAGAVKLVGKSGAKTVLKFTRPLLKRLPLIGALIDFGLSVALGEPLGRAAFSAIGAALLGTIGAGFGGPIGAVLGGLAGNWAGTKLYDILFNGKKEQGNKKVKGKASGGQVTSRGGTTVGGSIGRTQKVIRRVPKPPKLQAPESIPGKNIGGEKVIDKVFPKETSPEHISPLRSLKTSSSILKGSGSTLLSQTMAVGVDLAMGQKPTKEFYSKYGKAFGSFVQEMVNTNMEMTTQETARSILAMANGGTVPYNIPSRGPNFGEKVGEMVATAFANTVEKQSSLILNALKIESNKKSYTGITESDPTLEGDDEGGEGGMTKGTWGPLLDLIAGKESGGNYEAMYPSTTLKGATKMTIAEVARRATGAVGKYQQLPQYLVNRAKAAGLNPDKDLYSPENQEKIIINVNIKGRGGERWLKGEISDEEFMQGLSQEFASLPNAQGKFYYPGQSSAMTPAKVKAALSKVKKGGYSQAELAKGGKDPSIGLGKGYGSAGGKIAGELGRYLNKALVPGKDFLRVTEHPEHGGVRGRHARNSYHYDGRAVDIGAWDWEQPKILRAIADFNKKRGVKPVELLHAKNEPSGHSDHVHVAYKHGGLVTKPTHALIGETKKPEMVLDPDTTGTMNKEYPGMLAKLNAAKNKKQISEVLNTYASYENNNGKSSIILIPIEKIVNNTITKQTPGQSMTGGRSFSSDGLNIETLLA